MKVIWLVAAVLLLAGCTAQKDFETMSDVYYEPQKQAQEVCVNVPAEVTTLTGASGDTLYLCDGYSVIVETLAAGDLDRTLRHVSGFDTEQLQLMERRQDALRRIECVWSAAGEREEQVGRAVILDDGSYHYVLTFMADASCAGDLTAQWQTIVDSFSLDTGK